MTGGPITSHDRYLPHLKLLRSMSQPVSGTQIQSMTEVRVRIKVAVPIENFAQSVRKAAQ